MFQDIHAAYMLPFQVIGNLYFAGLNCQVKCNKREKKTSFGGKNAQRLSGTKVQLVFQRLIHGHIQTKVRWFHLAAAKDLGLQ